MLERMRGVRRFVFLETAGGAERFLGISTLEHVRWALARRQPWLEAALSRAYSEVFPSEIVQSTSADVDPNLTTKTYIESLGGRLGEDIASSFIQRFIELIQTNMPPGLKPALSAMAPLPGRPEQPEWYSINNAAPWECAKWIDGGLIEEYLRDQLKRACFLDSPYLTPTQRIEAVLKCDGPAVAVITGDGTFGGLVDRQLLLESVARQVDVSTAGAGSSS
jgi:hypothetical protein